MNSFKSHFQNALQQSDGQLHFAAHSHHLWPDVTQAAQQQCWQEAVTLADRKWDLIFQQRIPRLQTQIAKMLHLPDPQQVVFGPNVHGFLVRLFSCLPTDRPARVLTTDGEFYSFSRQSNRYLESGLIELVKVACDPFDSLTERLQAALENQDFNLVYLSHVFFDSGRVLQSLERMVAAVRSTETMIAIDGYHRFCALPTDLSSIADRVFYLAGGYKYAMSGEGCCFMAVPPGCSLRPRNTGWFASFDSLAEDQDTTHVQYSDALVVGLQVRRLIRSASIE